MRVAVSGATGLIGGALVGALRERGDDVVALTRDLDRARRSLPEGVELHQWRHPESERPPSAALAGADAVVHLLGEPIAQRWSAEAKRRIHDSRVLSTRSLVGSLTSLSPADRPPTLVSQSAIGYYGAHGDEILDEDAPGGDDFLAGVTAAWEREAIVYSEEGRVVVTRAGVVLTPSGGALGRMLPPFRLGVGGPVAGGRQYVPWIHLADVTGALQHLIGDEAARGPVNLVAPELVTNRELSRALGAVLHRPAVTPVPAIALKLLYGEMATIILTGQRAIPARLQALGYAFRFDELEPALRDVLGRP